jgi:hypothetical protein
MKKKTKILIVEPVILRLESPLPNDASLPKPRGAYPWNWIREKPVFDDYVTAKEPTQKVTVNTIPDAKKRRLREKIKKETL